VTADMMADKPIAMSQLFTLPHLHVMVQCPIPGTAEPSDLQGDSNVHLKLICGSLSPQKCVQMASCFSGFCTAYPLCHTQMMQ